MAIRKKIAFIFPGQGTQYVGMGKDFYQDFPVARDTFQEADEILDRRLSTTILEGPEDQLIQTKNSQLGIFVTSIALLRTISKLFPELKSAVCSGLSLGEYTALMASGKIGFYDCLNLVDRRGQFMNDACEVTRGSMAVVIGMSEEAATALVKEVNLPEDLWAANFNCPGQVVLSGTLKGLEAAAIAAKAKGAKRVMPLSVYGAFHSGLMMLAQERLTPFIDAVKLNDSPCSFVMNVTGAAARDQNEIRKNLIMQVTHPVYWERGVSNMIKEGVDLFVEIGPGKVLGGFSKRIAPDVPCLSIEKVAELTQLETALKG